MVLLEVCMPYMQPHQEKKVATKLISTGLRAGLMMNCINNITIPSQNKSYHNKNGTLTTGETIISNQVVHETFPIGAFHFFILIFTIIIGSLFI